MDKVSLTVEELLTNARIFAGDADAEHTGVMIAFFLDASTAGQLASVKGVTVKPEELHLTLSFLGSHESLTDVQIANAILATQNMARMHKPLTGTINGVGRFNASASSDNKDVIYAVVDAPELDGFRQVLMNILSDRDAPVSRTHGYTPHVTLAYIEAGSDSPIAIVPTMPLTFSFISIVVGSRRVDFPLSGMYDMPHNAQQATITAPAEAIHEGVIDVSGAMPEAVAPVAEVTTEEPIANSGIKTDQLVSAGGVVLGGTLDLAINTSLVRTVTKDSREYLVAPSVAIREGVLNGEFVPADEIEKFALAWNGRPVPLGHPKDNIGHISANTPELWDLTPAFFWNAQAKDGALTGEIWFDVQKAQKIGGLAVQAEQVLRQGLPMELSTAYFRDFEEGSGVFNSKPYTGTARNLRPDHIALLLDEPGACSWNDGCGAPRVNAQSVAGQTFIAEGVRDLARKVKQVFNSGRIQPMDREVMIGALVANAACKCSKQQLEAMDDATLAAVHDTVPVANTEEVPAVIPVETPAAVAVVEVPAPVATPLPQSVVDFAAMLDSLGGVDTIKAAFGAVVANSNKEHTDLVRRLVANKACALEKTELEAMPVETLRKLQTSFATRNYSGNAGSFAANALEDEDEFTTLAMPVIEKGK